MLSFSPHSLGMAYARAIRPFAVLDGFFLDGKFAHGTGASHTLGVTGDRTDDEFT